MRAHRSRALRPVCRSSDADRPARRLGAHRNISVLTCQPPALVYSALKPALFWAGRGYHKSQRARCCPTNAALRCRSAAVEERPPGCADTAQRRGLGSDPGAGLVGQDPVREDVHRSPQLHDDLQVSLTACYTATACQTADCAFGCTWNTDAHVPCHTPKCLEAGATS